MLESYYKSLSLDYERRNDISLFTKAESELKTIIDSAELNIIDVGNKIQVFDNKVQEREEKYNFI